MDGLPFAALVVMLVIAGIVIGVGAYQAFRIREIPTRMGWGVAAAQLGLERVDGSSYAGRIDGFEVTLVVRRPKSVAPILELRVSGGLPVDLTLGGKAMNDSVPEDVQTLGEASFDDTCWVRGVERSVLSTLDGATRTVLRAARDLCWRLEERVCRVEFADARGENLEAYLGRALALGKALRKSGGNDIDRISHVAARDRVVGLRRRALRWLLSNEPEHPSVRVLLEDKLSDRDFGIRFMAAEALGHLETFVDIVKAAGDPDRGRVLHVLVEVAPDHDLTREAIVHALRTKAPHDRLFRDATLTLIEERLLFGFEPTLIELLDVHDDDLRRHVMRVLGEVGTLAAVPALLPFRDMFIGFSLKDAAKDAVASIQARAKVPEHGALALAEEGGQLALVAIGEAACNVLGARAAGSAHEECMEDEPGDLEPYQGHG